MKEPNYIQIIAKQLNLSEKQVESTLKLINEENTIPFIARYRKEATNNLDETQIREIVELKEKQENLYKAKKTAINGISEQNKLTPELEEEIINTKNLKEVEDIYAPFRRKKKTKAQIAIEKGFEPIANQIKSQEKITISQKLLDNFSEEEVIEGAKDIVIQEIVDNSSNKQAFRYYFQKYGEIISNYKKSFENASEKAKNQIHKFEIYNNFSKNIQKLKPYQILALNRGENLKLLSVSLEKDTIPLDNLEERYIKKKENQDILKVCIKSAFGKIFKSIENEIRNMLTEKAEVESIRTFQKNLYKLLMTKPQYDKTILAIDPGFRTGCKITILNKETEPVEFSKIYLKNEKEALSILKQLISKYTPDTIVLGNGTASNETYELIKNNCKFEIPIVLINESGASVYSASDVGKEEFPNLDATDRGTVSIGRRYIDPLAELVKIPVHSIGVGMYQHDINQKELEKKLSYVLEDVVNLVGVNVNTASVYVLKNISGLNIRSAKKIVSNKPYKNREELKKILTKKTYEQAIGFLRVPNSTNKFDNTDIHPEQYDLAEFIIENKISKTNFKQYENKIKNLYNVATEETVADILKAFENMGKELRVFDGNLKIDKTLSIDDLKEDDIVKGIVRNVMQFGAFVDIGVKNNGLIHISQLANKFVKDPLEIVQVGEEVKVKIIRIDKEKSKIQLSLKDIEN